MRTHGKKPAKAAPAPRALPRRLAMALLLLWGAYAAGHVPFWPAMAMTYLVMSGVTYGVYAADKAAALQGRWRVAESTLHLLALTCGWPGALLAQRLLRHKIRKPLFVGIFWATVVLNLAGVFGAGVLMAAGVWA